MSSESPSSPPAPVRLGLAKRTWNYLTSFQLAVLVFSLSIALVFFGTLAQVHEGLYLAQVRWFKSWFVIRQGSDPWWVVPIFPGGYLLGTLFLVNMLGAHFRRFKFPPGGWFVMIVHYVVIMAALFFITRYVLWLPFYFSMALLGLMGLDLMLCIPNGKLQSSGKKIGVDLIHLGIAILLLGQLATDLFARETHLAFREGETKHYSESHLDTELAVIRSADAKMDEVVVIPDSFLTAPEKTLTQEKLPFSFRVKDWMVNSDLVDREEARTQDATLRQALATLESKYSQPEQLPAEAANAKGTPGRVHVWEESLKALGEPAGTDIAEAAKRLTADPAKAARLITELRTRFRKEMTDRFQMQGGAMAFAARAIAAGKTVDENFPAPQASSPVAGRYFTTSLPESRDMESRNIPSAVVELTGRDGTSLGSWLVTPALKEQTLAAGGQDYRIGLRFSRAYHPFAMTLLKTTHEKYAGTDIPKDFRSKVRVREDKADGDREVDIFMNSPLRFDNGNLTFYQSQMGRDAANANLGTSSLQVVENPGWFSPYFGCVLVSYGMCRHFLLHLLRFVSKKKVS